MCRSAQRGLGLMAGGGVCLAAADSVEACLAHGARTDLRPHHTNLALSEARRCVKLLDHRKCIHSSCSRVPRGGLSALQPTQHQMRPSIDHLQMQRLHQNSRLAGLGVAGVCVCGRLCVW
jgi:hypothetical protein